MNPELAPADRLLLDCARALIRGGDVGAVPADVDVEALLESGRRHQLLPLLYRALGEGHFAKHAPDILPQLKLAYHRNGLRNAFIRKRLIELLQAADQAGVELMALKGAVLAFNQYPEPDLRALGDIDLLVREDDCAKLEETLARLGYHPASLLPALSAKDLPFYAHCFSQLRFPGRQPPQVEVHFRLLNLGLPGDVEPAWEDPATVQMDGVMLRTPSVERFCLHLCMHAHQHGFSVLRLFLDIAFWLRSHSLDVARFCELARQNHLASSAYFSLVYAKALLDIPLPEGLPDALLQSARGPRGKQWWDSRRILSLSAGKDATEAELPKLYLLGEAPLSRKLAFLLRVMFPPAEWLTAKHGPRSWQRVRHIASIFSHAIGRS